MLDAFALGLVLLPALPLLITLFNLSTWRRGKLQLGQTPPSLSVLIPARNEERNIKEALESVLSAADSCQIQLKEVLVYDDGSDDQTAQHVREVEALDSRVRLIHGVSLPPGWVGKPHACQKLFENSKGEMLLFMDADVRLSESAFVRLLSLSESPIGGQVISAVPAQEVGSWLERLLLPLLTLTYTSWLPLRLIEVGQNPSTVAANGQLMMMRRRDCERLEGFTRVGHEIVDDVAFCRLAKSHGLKVVFADGFHMARCRMYRSGTEVWKGFSKNLFEGLGGAGTAWLVVLLYLGCFVTPYLTLLLGILNLGVPERLLVAAAGGIGLNLTLRGILAWRFRQPAEGILLHPISVLVLVVLTLNSMLWVVRGKIEWAGRSYESRSTRKQVKAS